ncbi:RNA polymerase sigma factor [Aliikangiella coralliicola]|uniref:RNA polymerase sigma factor n=1 Tax=Aliikangiella coralliicola TaxID=2592383 RepID=A0A545U4G1_9GAMM|nr:RNA polymerase sigma factor [Aliikangiella coralliicola]TQV84359.1 RNA polymerase sigma factor [Aliikangiella coralliicola]
MTEQELISQSLTGDTSCFEQLVIRYEKKLMRFLILRCNCRNDADDIFQETFLNAHLYLQSYNTRYAFSTWLFNIALNLIKKHVKGGLEKSSQKIDSLEPSNLPTVEPVLEANHETTQNTTQNIWHLAKKTLNNEQFCLLWFTYAEEYTGREVAFMLDRSLPWVKINLIRAKQQLKQALTSENLKLIDLISS